MRLYPAMVVWDFKSTASMWWLEKSAPIFDAGPPPLPANSLLRTILLVLTITVSVV